MENDVTVVIRAAGERTEEACLKQVLTEAPNESVFLIREKPFWRAVQKNFEIGIQQNKGWTLALDADIVLYPGAISKMIKAAKKYGPNLFIYQGYVIDKVLCDYRPGGPHLYKTDHLKEALEYLQQKSEILRPESDTYKVMARKGKLFYNDNKVYGYHDFGQYYYDLFRKGYFHAMKSARIPELVKKLTVLYQKTNDKDFYAVLQGVQTGILDKRVVKNDIDFLKGAVKSVFEASDISEKNKIEMSELSQFLETKETLDAHTTSGFYKMVLPKKFIMENDAAILARKFRDRLGKALYSLANKVSKRAC